MSWVDTYGGSIAQLARGELPLAMLLGHVQRESAGRPATHTSLDERGLFQIHPGTSKHMGFDHERMFEPFYNIWAGVEMFKKMGDRLQKDFAAWFPTRDAFFWRVLRFEFAIGSGATRQIIRSMESAGFRPVEWSQFKDYLVRNRDALFKLTKHDPVKWANATDKVFEGGEKILRGVKVGGGGLVAVGVLGALGVTAYLVWRHTQRERLPSSG